MGELVPFEGGRPPAVFANRQSSLNAAAKANVAASFAVIGYKGRAWSIKFRGDAEILKGANGAPMQFLDVVIVGVSPSISKQFYETGYVEGSDSAPDCFSVDGVIPDPAAPKKQCTTCAACPKNQWGSKITEAGKKGKACQDSRRVAVVPLTDIENEDFGGPMLLRVPPMSLGNLANYATMLDRKGASMEMVGTRLGFDYDVAYPRITFNAVCWLDDEQARAVVGPDGQSGMCAHPVIDRMLQEEVAEATHDPAQPADPLAGGRPAQAFQRPAEAPAPQPVVQAAPVAQAPQAAPAPAPSPAPSVTVCGGCGADPAAGEQHDPNCPRVVAAPEPAAAAQVKAQRKASPFAAAAATAAPAQPAAPAPATVAAAVTVQAAPSDMQAAIDELLAAPVGR